MRIALVHDHLRESGGAERVLRALADMYPEAPIHVAFRVNGSTSDKEFSDRVVVESFLAPILKIWKLYSPLRILTPIVWRSFNLKNYDVVISSAGWYITRGFRVGKNTKVICYCHTPPRWLYGFETAGRYQKFWLVRIYAKIVGKILRLYDKWSVSTVHLWIANSDTVRKRIRKFYGVDSKVIYPPVNVNDIIKKSQNIGKKDYLLIVSRLTGAKGILESARAANKHKFKLKIVGEAADVSGILSDLKKEESQYVELLGRVGDESLTKLYAESVGFLALARDEDFGITPVEAMASGTPVIAYKGGGFLESVVEDITGVFVKDTSPETIYQAYKKLISKKWDRSTIQKQAKKFSKENFIGQMSDIIAKI